MLYGLNIQICNIDSSQAHVIQQCIIFKCVHMLKLRIHDRVCNNSYHGQVSSHI